LATAGPILASGSMPPASEDVTALLRAWSQGEADAGERLLRIVYGDLRRQAARLLRRERRDHTLEPTALVHEAYLRLVDWHDADWRNRTHFFAVAARAMRRILVDHARRHGAGKRGGSRERVTLDESRVARPGAFDVDVLALEDALAELQALDPEKVRLVELRFFGGLGVEEAAAVLGVSRSTVNREWRLARAWLFRRLGGLAERRQ
jgi:RNA polymerase sigma-70 factor (ECF subfamily)